MLELSHSALVQLVILFAEEEAPALPVDELVVAGELLVYLLTDLGKLLFVEVHD